MSHSSRAVTDKRFFRTQFTILLLCTSGFIFGWYRLFWPGLFFLVIAAVMFVVLAFRDTPKLSARERRLAWERIRAQGFTRYLLGQLKLALYSIVPMLLMDLLSYPFTGRGLWPQKLVLRISFFLIGGILVLTLVRWYREERPFKQLDSE